MKLSLHNGRRIVLLAALATVAFAGSAMAGTAAIVSTSTGFNADPGANRPNNRTEDRTPTINYAITLGTSGDAIECNIDGTGWVPCSPGPSSVSGDPTNGSWTPASNLKLGAHTFQVRSPATGTPASYSFRIEPPQYFELIKSYSPKGYWELDDAASASAAADASGNGYNGDYENFPIKRQPAGVSCENQPHPPFACDWEEGPLDPDTGQPTYSGSDGGASTYSGRDGQGWSAYFGGRDDHVQIENVPNGTNTSWAVEAWVKPDFAAEERGVFQHVPSLWTVKGTNPTDTRFACSGLNDEDAAVKSADITRANFQGKWIHVVCKYDSGTYSLYVNGLKTTGAAGPSYVTPNGGQYQGLIGLVNKSADKWWKGWIDNVALYSTATPMSDDSASFDHEVGTISDARYAANANGVNDDLSPPSSGSDISIPANNAQYSVDAQSYKDPDATYACGASSPIAPTTTALGATFVGLAPIGGSANYELMCQKPGPGTFTWYHRHAFNRHGPAGFGFVNLLKCLSPVPAAGCSAPFAYYRLNEISGATVLDDELNAFDGEFKNRTGQGGTGISGDNNNAREFFGLDSGYAAVNNIAAPLWGYTLEAWWKPADNGSMMILQHGSNGAIWYDGANLRFRPDERGGAASLPIAVTPGQWYYVAGTYDGITGKLYAQQSVNPNITLLGGSGGAAVASHYQDGAGSADTFYLGYGDQLSGGGWLRGELDEVAYYGSALSQTKLTEHFNADPPAGDVKYAPLVKSKDKSAAAKAKARAKAKAKAKAKARAKAKAKARAKAKAKARAKAKAKRRARARRH